MLNYPKKIKKFIKSIITIQTPPTLILKQKSMFKIYNNLKETKLISFGNKNPDKVFYVIKRTPGAGFFSNVLFVLNHLKIALHKKYIPVVDMENFYTIYNEKHKIFNSNNAWEYYFENFTKIPLNEIYQSKNVIITGNNFEKTFEKDLTSEQMIELFNKQIKIKRVFKRLVDYYCKFKFKDKKILGVHFRGTSYKRSPGHPLPATKVQMYKLISMLLNKEKYEKIFLVTEEKQYKEFLIKKFHDKIICLNSSFRSNSNNAFKIYPRYNHRYKLGREALIETNLLSKCHGFLYITSNISSAALAWKINVNQKQFKINNGINSKNIFIAQILWYIKIFLPSFLNGFQKHL